MKKKDLIELYHQVEEAAEERRRLGEFDANSKYVMTLLEGLQTIIGHAIDDHGRFVVAPRIAKKKEGKK